MNNLRSKFEEFLSEYKDKKLLILSHINADLDAVCSSLVLNKYLKNSEWRVFEKMDEPANILHTKKAIPFKFYTKGEEKEFDGVVILDSSSWRMVPPVPRENIVLVIDHHHPKEDPVVGKYTLRNPDSPSTAQILYELGTVNSKEQAELVSIAIISDTARFKVADANTFEALGTLMSKYSLSYLDLLSFGSPEPTLNSKLIVLDALKSIKSITYKGYLISTLKAKRQESFVSSQVSELSDIVFVAKKENGVVKVSSRARPHVDIDLSEIMREVGKHFNSSGGGHPKAAGCFANSNSREEVLNLCVKKTIEYLDNLPS